MSSKRSRSRSPGIDSRPDKESSSKEVEECRTVYIGNLLPGTTRNDIRKRFDKFGVITNIRLHKRIRQVQNYGFVTFKNGADATNAIEHGNDDPSQPKYELNYGKRRTQGRSSYSDFDNMPERQRGKYASTSFDQLLEEAKRDLRKRKS